MRPLRHRPLPVNNLSAQKILILNGPNLNMLGVREPSVYGHQTLQDIKVMCVERAGELSLSVDFRQSNHEGELVTWIQEERENICGLIINAAAYTHTSVAIHDALKLLNVPIVEVHLSDPATREDFRHFSYIEPLAAKIIKGKGAAGYVEAINTLSTLVKAG
ncbi:MAG: 3-dehydroquinate dehydratase [Micavibrio aeruginosavorus]|uniref:3-dehydroquinate dehydratase n=1 Tax=Micavibrio aeruginosavorus TaxID=349221 RepID=A0A2W5Q5R1_9BACT|nr:MAG: 3-dehydroquinate dehydratase [Micavibrio aeruginosavorus]